MRDGQKCRRAEQPFENELHHGRGA
jgi:hypothetical protein